MPYSFAARLHYQITLYALSHRLSLFSRAATKQHKSAASYIFFEQRACQRHTTVNDKFRANRTKPVNGAHEQQERTLWEFSRRSALQDGPRRFAPGLGVHAHQVWFAASHRPAATTRSTAPYTVAGQPPRSAQPPGFPENGGHSARRLG